MDQKDFDVLFPRGDEVDYDGGVAVVLPIGIRHTFPFKDALGKLVGVVARQFDGSPKSDAEIAGAIAIQAMPVLTDDLFGLLESTVVIGHRAGGKFVPEFDRKLGAEPHWIVPDIVGAWMDLNLSEDKVRPWIRVIEKAVTRITKKPFDLLKFMRPPSPEPDSTSKPPSTDSNIIPTGGPSPTEDGQQTSSNTGPSPQLEPSQGR